MDVMVDAAVMAALGDLLGDGKVQSIFTEEEASRITEICEAAIAELELTLGVKESDDELTGRLISVFRETGNRILTKGAGADVEHS